MSIDSLAEQVVGGFIKGGGGVVVVGIMLYLVWKLTNKSSYIATSDRPPSFFNFFFALMTKVGPLLIILLSVIELALIIDLMK